MAKGLSSTQRTIRELRNRGIICAVVEKFNPHVGPHGIRQDLFYIIDVLALDPERGFLGVQCCTTAFKQHIDKMTIEHAQESYDWLSTPGGCLELWGWRKLKLHRGSKAVRWTPRVQEITIDMLEVK